MAEAAIGAAIAISSKFVERSKFTSRHDAIYDKELDKSTKLAQRFDSIPREDVDHFELEQYTKLRSQSLQDLSHYKEMQEEYKTKEWFRDPVEKSQLRGRVRKAKRRVQSSATNEGRHVDDLDTYSRSSSSRCSSVDSFSTVSESSGLDLERSRPYRTDSCSIRAIGGSPPYASLEDISRDERMDSMVDQVTGWLSSVERDDDVMMDDNLNLPTEPGPLLQTYSSPGTRTRTLDGIFDQSPSCDDVHAAQFPVTRLPTAKQGRHTAVPSWLPTKPSSSKSSSALPSSNSANPPTDTSTSTTTYSFFPGLSTSSDLSRPLGPLEQENIAHFERLRLFLRTAPHLSNHIHETPHRARQLLRASSAAAAEFSGGAYDLSISTPYGPVQQIHGDGGADPGMRMTLQPATHFSLVRFPLPNHDFVTCVFWNGLVHITGTDIIRALVFRFEAFGRRVPDMKKFEEDVLSDLRDMKPGVDACLEEPKSPFLDLLFKYQCISTQMKQKVFYWHSVPHDRLFLDALERDLKREKMSIEPTTQIIGEPALSFSYDCKRGLYEQCKDS